MRFASFLVELSCVLVFAALASAQTNPNDVAALGDLKQALLSLRNYPAVSTWSGDPCGAVSNCCFFNASSSNGIPSCHWAHICCSSYHVTYVDAGCIYQNCSSSNSIITVPSSLKSMSKLTFLNLSANGFSGPLPSPFTSTLLIGLDLSLNSFNGNLPSNWSSLTLLDFLYVNNNQLTGAVPSTWLNLQSLTQLDLSVICGLCGGVPVPRGVYIWFGGTALGYQCGTFNACAGSKNLILTTLAIGGGILAGLFVTGMVGRLIVLRLYSRSALQTQEEPEWAPTSRYLNYAQRRVQEIITQGRLPPPSPAFIPLFEVSLGEEGGAMSPSDATREPTMIPVGANKYAILVEAPGDTCLCLAHPDANEEPPAAESKKKSKRKKKGTEEDKPPVDDVEMGTLRSNPQALSSQVSPNTSNMIIPPVPRIAYPLEDTEPSPNPHSSSSNQRVGSHPSPSLAMWIRGVKT